MDKFPNVSRERARLKAEPVLGPVCADGDCPNMRCVHEGWDGETYRCPVCKKGYKMYYDDMR